MIFLRKMFLENHYATAQNKHFFGAAYFLFFLIALSACSGSDGGSIAGPKADAQNSEGAVSAGADGQDTGFGVRTLVTTTDTQTRYPLYVGPFGRRHRRVPVEGRNSNTTMQYLPMGTNGANVQDPWRTASSPGERMTPPNPLAGTWISRGHKLIFNSDNTYSGDPNNKGMPAVWGAISVSGNLVMISDAGGNQSCLQSAAVEVRGSYIYTIIGSELTFSPVYDPCSQRAALLGFTYRKK